MPVARTRPLRVLDFDCEMRPLSWIGQDYVSAEVTAIAASWMDQTRVHVWLLGRHTSEEILTGFLRMYEQADIVTGHYIRKHDLPVLSGALLEFGLGPMPAKRVSDTQADLVKHKYLSASQESLSDTWGLNNRKEHMTQPQWRAANRLTPQGLKETRRRVAGDVREHKEQWAYAAANGYLRIPRMWTP